jgi:phosphomannomutase
LTYTLTSEIIALVQVIYGEEFVNKFIFDVDGTLTPSRGKINLEFKQFFNTFCLTNDVYLVTGSDKPKTVEQISEETYNLAKRVYNCSGCDVWEANKSVRSSDWNMPREQLSWLEDKLEESRFVLRTGQHVEQRNGMVNFSIVGRGATIGERKLYVEYDQENNERQTIADLFEHRFINMQATVGGETGIDIAPKGSDKSQILVDFAEEDTVHFFGDAMFEGGNDYPLKRSLWERGNSSTHQVHDWKDTWAKLKELK